jgi:hypothetical protein
MSSEPEDDEIEIEIIAVNIEDEAGGHAPVEIQVEIQKDSSESSDSLASRVFEPTWCERLFFHPMNNNRGEGCSAQTSWDFGPGKWHYLIWNIGTWWLGVVAVMACCVGGSTIGLGIARPRMVSREKLTWAIVVTSLI